MPRELYQPDIQSLLEVTKDEWGDPEINRAHLVPYGISYFDKYLYGIDIVNGELILVMGQEKRRKTTFAINVLINYMTSDSLKEKPVTVVDTLESGMPPSRYRDQMLSNLASRWLIAEGHFPKGSCSQCGANACRQLTLTPEYLRYNNRTSVQMLAVEYAMDTMSSWPLYIFGASQRQGATRDLITSVKGDVRDESTWQWKHHRTTTPNQPGDPTRSRWDYMISEFGAQIFIADHIQQYAFSNEPTDYEKQLRAISAISNFVAERNIAAMVLSQVSLTSVRDAREGRGRMSARGGSKLAEEANVALSTHYDPDFGGKMSISIEESRKSGAFHVLQRIEDRSGAFYGNPEIFWKRIDLRMGGDDD